MALVNYSIPKVLLIDELNSNIGYSENGIDIGDFTIPSANYTAYDLLKIIE